MPRRKKKAHELTTEQAMRKLFSKEVVQSAKEEAVKARKSGGKSTIKGKDR